jgi:GH25 family lysozyme M1 (1,4-beta-N-acetylmuramidase)
VSLNNYQIVLDVWEADVKLDEPVLLANGVKGLIIRMNETLNRERLDYNFKKQWGESAGFYRGAYVVFGDWMTVEQQVKFVIDNRPIDCHLIALDVECDANTINPVKVAGDLCEVKRQLESIGLHVIIYSGGWWWNSTHIQVGLPWQSITDYWWASYDYLFQPDNSRKSISWDALKALISRWTWNTGMAPGPCQLRQVCSRYILPGTGGLNVDINVFNGSEKDLADYFGGNAAVPPVPPPPFPPVFTPYQVTINVTATPYVNVRPTPGTAQPAVGHVFPGMIVTITSEATAPDGLWGKITTPIAGWIRLDFTTRN